MYGYICDDVVKIAGLEALAFESGLPWLPLSVACAGGQRTTKAAPRYLLARRRHIARSYARSTVSMSLASQKLCAIDDTT